MFEYAASNYLELYTSMMAWSFYESLLGILTDTGLIYVPFIAKIVSATIESRKRKNADEYMEDAMNEIWLKVFVVVLAVVPMIEISKSEMKFTKYSCVATAGNSASKTSSDVYLSSDGTTYADTQAGTLILNASTVKIPLWWAFWNNVSHGLAAASSAGLPCKADVRALANDIDAMQITDPLLRGETRAFYQACWRPSISEFYRKSPVVPSTIKDVATDVSWPGSQFFLQTNGYYDFYRAKYPLKSFSYDEIRDGMIVAKKYAEGGYPYCNEWWEDSGNGLRKRLVEAFPLSTMDKLSVYFSNPAGSFPANNAVARTAIEDEILREKLTGDKAIQGSLAGLSSLHTGEEEHGQQFVQNLVTSVGLAVSSATHYTKLRLVKQLAPVVQAIMLLLFVFALPLMLVIGEFGIETITNLTVFYFSVIFWGFLFDAAAWLDAFLLEGASLGQGITSKEVNASISHLLRETNFMWAVDFLTSALYVTLPVVFTVLLGLVSRGMAKDLSQGLSNWTSSAGGAAGAGASKASKIAGK